MSASRSSRVGSDRIRHFLYINGRWRWRPTKKMRTAGFHLINLGRGGPDLDALGRPVPSLADMARAVELNAEWDRFAQASCPCRKPFIPLAV